MKPLFCIVGGPRLGGKCLKEGTLVHTVRGPKAIESVEPGDMVYGFNKDGSVSPAKVLARINQGVKEVVDLLYSNKVVATATKEHRWWTLKPGRDNGRVGTTNELFASRRLARRFVPHDGGDVIFPQAYALGVLLGNGCCRDGSSKRFDVSSACEAMVASTARLLGGTYKSAHESNYTWHIAANKSALPYYNDWAHNRYSHEKIIDVEQVATWDRRSQVALLAGLIDTDGSIGRSEKNKSVTLSFSSTSTSLANGVSYLITSLFQTTPHMRLSQRDDKRDCWDVRVNSGFHTARILKEMDEFIQSPQKKYKEEYDTVAHQRNAERMQVREGSSYSAQCWDLTVDNETSLYLLTNEGLVTHNTTLCGTLPGKTHLLQASVRESGSRSAQRLAKKRGNVLVVEDFDGLVDLWPKLDAAYASDCDHIYIDGLSAINDLRWGCTDVQKAHKNNPFQAYDIHGHDMVELLLRLKTYSFETKNIFVTCAMRYDASSQEIKLECNGKMIVTAITKMAEGVLTMMKVPVEGGEKRVMLTASKDGWPARLDGLLDEDNPGSIEPDLSVVLDLLKESEA